MKKIVIFNDFLDINSDTDAIFVGYVENKLFLEKESVMLSRAHRQPNRIYSTKGIHPAICASETQGRYYILIPLSKTSETYEQQEAEQDDTKSVETQ
jgi:hypothetical protein